MQYLALKERLKETLNEDVAEISLPGEELDDEQQFEYIQAKVIVLSAQCSQHLHGHSINFHRSMQCDTKLTKKRLRLQLYVAPLCLLCLKKFTLGNTLP